MARESQATYCCASSQLVLCSGVASSATDRRGSGPQPFCAWQAFHSPTVTGCWPRAKARRVTRWAGAALASFAPWPMVKLPAGMRTIRGHVGQSWKLARASGAGADGAGATGAGPGARAGEGVGGKGGGTMAALGGSAGSGGGMTADRGGSAGGAARGSGSAGCSAASRSPGPGGAAEGAGSRKADWGGAGSGRGAAACACACPIDGAAERPSISSRRCVAAAAWREPG